MNIAHESNKEVLRQVATHLERENERLHKKVRALITELSQLRNESPEKLQRELLKLTEQLAAKNHELFGRSSEKREHASAIGERETPVQRGHGPREQPALLEVEQHHALDAADMMCPSCGGELSEWEGQLEESEEVDVVERRFVLIKHKRKKYRCQCGGCVETALGPTKLREGNRYSVDFAIEVAAAKYLDHLPLERQVRIMRREGLRVDSQTLWDQLEALARPLRAVPDRILSSLLGEPCVGMDETQWHMLSGKGPHWWVWTMTGRVGVVHRIYETRGAEAARAMLGDYAGVVMSDGLASYESAQRTGRFVQAFCWAHVRRKFLEAEGSYPRPAGAVVALIDELFALERTGPPPGVTLLEWRHEKSRSITKALECWGIEIERTQLPESSLAKAAAYMSNLWPGLVRFLTHAHVPLSNNASERGLRGVVIGRKNHYGSKSKRGTEVAALFYSLFESAKLCGIEPKAYLRAAVRAALAGAVVPLPHEVAAGLLERAKDETDASVG